MTEINPGPGWWQAADGEWYPPRWEYRWVRGRLYSIDSKIKPERRGNDLEVALAELGSQGWEAVGTAGEPITMDSAPMTVLMKRPLRP